MKLDRKEKAAEAVVVGDAAAIAADTGAVAEAVAADAVATAADAGAIAVVTAAATASCPSALSLPNFAGAENPRASNGRREVCVP
jgi:hypothetical protein